VGPVPGSGDPPARPTAGPAPGPRADGVGGLGRTDRLGRLAADLAADLARFALTTSTGAAERVIAELRLVERLAIDDRTLRASMFRQGRRVRPLGLRNGIRATVYPMSQTARRLRGG